MRKNEVETIGATVELKNKQCVVSAEIENRLDIFCCKLESLRITMQMLETKLWADCIALSDQTGSLYARVPYFGRINAKTSQNNDGGTDIQTSTVSTFDQGFVSISRMDAWTERDFSTFITAGVDFMDNVANQLQEYKFEVRQDILLAMLEGAFSMDTDGDTVEAKANKEFIDNHSYDAAGYDDDGVVFSSTLNKALQQAGGDNKNVFKLVIMHSMVATNLENLKLLRYMTYTDSLGLEQDLTMATWNGRLVLIDDNMPVYEGNPVDGTEEGTYYTTYVLDMPLLDTRSKDRDLTGVFVADLVLQILSYVAQTERENIRKRQAEGIAIAKEKGKHLGRPSKPIPKNFESVHKMCVAKEISIGASAKLLDVSRTTYLNWAKLQNIRKKIKELSKYVAYDIKRWYD